MDDEAKQSALMSALTTEHIVLQTAASSTISEAEGRSSLYILSLSSSLIAIAFMSKSPEMLLPFVAAVLPVLLLLGLFTVIRLIDTSIDNMQYLIGIARIRRYYRTLTPDAGLYFSVETGRWPEAKLAPSQGLGDFMLSFGTTATMIAFINSVVAGVMVTLGIQALMGKSVIIAVICGVLTAFFLVMTFVKYQNWRFSTVDSVMEPPSTGSLERVSQAR